MWNLIRSWFLTLMQHYMKKKTKQNCLYHLQKEYFYWPALADHLLITKHLLIAQSRGVTFFTEGVSLCTKASSSIYIVLYWSLFVKNIVNNLLCSKKWILFVFYYIYTHKKWHHTPIKMIHNLPLHKITITRDIIWCF